MKSSIVILVLRNKQYYRVVTALITVVMFAFLLVSMQIVKLGLCTVSKSLG